MTSTTRKVGSRILLSLAIATASWGAHAITLDEFVPPVEGGTTEPQAPVAQQDEIIKADTMQDGLGYAYQQIMADDGLGIFTVQTKTGMGVISGASAGYQLYENINATLLSKRGAYFKAFTSAQAQLVKHLEGFTNQCEVALSDQTLVIDSGVESVANSSSTSQEVCGELAQGVLAGFITYQVNDDVDNNVVSVSLASSTQTRSAVERVGGAVVVSSDPEKAFEHIATEISAGVVPPLGAKLIFHPDTNEAIVIGFGSAIVRQNSNSAMMGKMRTLAKRQAQIRANHALVSFLNGSEVYWQGGFEEDQVESTQQFDIPTGENGELRDPVAYDTTRNNFLNTVKMSDDYRVVTGGQLPPGIMNKTFPSEDGYWMNSLAVYMLSATAQAKQAGQENRAASGKLNDASAATDQGTTTQRNMRMEGGLAADSENPQGPSGKLVRGNDF